MATGDRVCERCENFHVTAAVTRQAEYKNYWRDFFELGVAFHGLKQKQQQICTSICGHGGFNRFNKRFEHVALRRC